MIYLDSSAIVKLMIEEPATAALHTELTADDAPLLFTSQLAVTEVKRALHARGKADLASAVAGPASTLVVPGHAILARPISHEVVSAAGDLLPSSALRSLDALHLATAMVAGQILTAVVTYDHRMAKAAAELGLEVRAPQATSPGDAAS
jgi:predicted nucleic acid-binding protein